MGASSNHKSALLNCISASSNQLLGGKGSGSGIGVQWKHSLERVGWGGDFSVFIPMIAVPLVVVAPVVDRSESKTLWLRGRCTSLQYFTNTFNSGT